MNLSHSVLNGPSADPKVADSRWRGTSDTICTLAEHLCEDYTDEILQLHRASVEIEHSPFGKVHRNSKTKLLAKMSFRLSCMRAMQVFTRQVEQSAQDLCKLSEMAMPSPFDQLDSLLVIARYQVPSESVWAHEMRGL